MSRAGTTVFAPNQVDCECDFYFLGIWTKTERGKGRKKQNGRKDGGGTGRAGEDPNPNPPTNNRPRTLSLAPPILSLPLSLSSSTAASVVEPPTTTTEARLSAILRANGVKDFSFKRVPSDYYSWPFESRRDVLGAASIHHLCKSIVLVNTQAPSNVTDCSNRNYSKYYVVVVVQYTARFNAETVKNFLYVLNGGKIPKKKINLRLAPEEVSQQLTGYEHNGVTCVGMRTDIPVILDEGIVKLSPDFFWLGGGEIDLKLGIRTSEFIDYVKPFIVNCSGT